MKQYIGTTVVNAKPMTLAEYCKYRELQLHPDADGEALGYLVEQVEYDEGATWSSADSFEQSYYEVSNLTFGFALEAMKVGHKMARVGWNGKGMFLFLVKGSKFQVNRPPLLGIYPEGTTINYLSHIDMRTADGHVVPWVASQSDLLGTDWVLVE